MDAPLNVVGIAGSLRKASHSKIVLNAMSAMLPASSTYAEIDISVFPFYNEDLEKPTRPAVVTAAHALVEASDMVMVVLPEYNHSVPGALKNALDWLSRPVYHGAFRGKPVMFATLSGGALGGVRAQPHMREVLASMQCQLIALPEIVIAHAQNLVSGGVLTDQATISFLRTQLERFIGSIRVDVTES